MCLEKQTNVIKYWLNQEHLKLISFSKHNLPHTYHNSSLSSILFLFFHLFVPEHISLALSLFSKHNLPHTHPLSSLYLHFCLCFSTSLYQNLSHTHRSLPQTNHRQRTKARKSQHVKSVFTYSASSTPLPLILLPTFKNMYPSCSYELDRRSPSLSFYYSFSLLF